MVCGEFSSDGKLFAQLSEQGVNIWDTEINKLVQEHKPNLHIAYTALKWIDSDEDRLSYSNRLLALGNVKGYMSIYSCSEGQIIQQLEGEGHNGKLTSITKDNTGNLYTCGEDCQIIVWSLQAKKKTSFWYIGSEKPYSVAFLPHLNGLIIGAREIYLYSIQSEKLLKTFMGQAFEVHLLSVAWIENEEYILSASRMERIISVWKVNTYKETDTAALTLIMNDISLYLSSQVIGSILNVVSVIRSGLIHVYSLTFSSVKSGQSIKPDITMQIAYDNNDTIERLPFIAASFELKSISNEVFCAYGDKHFMNFEFISLNYNEKMQQLIRKHPNNMEQLSAKSSFKTSLPLIKPEDIDYKSSASLRKSIKTTELPIEQRLQNLESIQGTDSDTMKSQSKAHLLSQALQSKDKMLIRSVICIKDAKVIEATLRKLPVQHVGALVNELTLLMEQKRYYIEFALCWLKVLLHTHFSQLIAIGKNELLNKFGPCLGIINYRAQSLFELTKLDGRLQMLVGQIKRNSIEICNDDHLIYEEADSNTMIKMSDEGSSNDEWEENEDQIEKMDT